MKPTVVKNRLTVNDCSEILVSVGQFFVLKCNSSFTLEISVSVAEFQTSKH